MGLNRKREQMKALLPAMLVPPAIAAGLLGLFRGDGFPNYDTEYALVWGRSLAGGHGPDLDALLSPTPHPLANAIGALLALVDPVSGSAPHGTASESLVTAAGFLWLGVLGFLVFRLGQRWAGPAAGVIAALIVLTREPVLSFGVRAYVDIPYVCLVLAALLRESRLPRDGAGTLTLLALAGLLRPEAWLFAAGYLVYLWWPQRWATARLPLLVALAAAGPLLWALHDLLISGDALYSLTGTRANADELRRATGVDDLPITGARRLGEIAREPVLLGAAAGIALAWWRLREQHAIKLGLASLGAASLAFGLLAAAGLPIITRYLLLPAVLLSLLAALAIVACTRLAAGDRARRPALVAASAIALSLVAFAPGQAHRIDRLRDAITAQTSILTDLRDVVPQIRRADCQPLAIPNQRAVPQLALWLDIPASSIVVAQHDGVPTSGTYARPASVAVARRFVLDRRDADQAIPAPPRDAAQAAWNGSWIVTSTCAHAREWSAAQSLIAKCLKTSPPSSPVASVGLPMQLFPRQTLLLSADLSGDRLVARAIVATSVTAAHDAILRRGPKDGWTVQGSDNKGEKAEIYLRRATTRVTIRLDRAGRCASAATATIAVAG